MLLSQPAIAQASLWKADLQEGQHVLPAAAGVARQGAREKSRGVLAVDLPWGGGGHLEGCSTVDRKAQACLAKILEADGGDGVGKQRQVASLMDES